VPPMKWLCTVRVAGVAENELIAPWSIAQCPTVRTENWFIMTEAVAQHVRQDPTVPKSSVLLLLVQLETNMCLRICSVAEDAFLLKTASLFFVLNPTANQTSGSQGKEAVAHSVPFALIVIEASAMEMMTRSVRLDFGKVLIVQYPYLLIKEKKNI